MKFIKLSQGYDYYDEEYQLATQMAGDMVMITSTVSNQVCTILQLPGVRNYILYRKMLYVLQAFPKQLLFSIYELRTGLLQFQAAMDVKYYASQLFISESRVFAVIIETEAKSVRLVPFDDKLNVIKCKFFTKEEHAKSLKFSKFFAQILDKVFYIFELEQKLMYTWILDGGDNFMKSTPKAIEIAFLLVINKELFLNNDQILSEKLTTEPLVCNFDIQPTEVIYRGRKAVYQSFEKLYYLMQKVASGLFEFSQNVQDVEILINNQDQELVVMKDKYIFEEVEFPLNKQLKQTINFYKNDIDLYTLGVNTEDKFAFYKNEELQQTFESQPLWKVYNDKHYFVDGNTLFYMGRQMPLISGTILDFDAVGDKIIAITDCGIVYYSNNRVNKVIQNTYQISKIFMIDWNCALALSDQHLLLLFITEFGVLEKRFPPITDQAVTRIYGKEGNIYLKSFSRTEFQIKAGPMHSYFQFFSQLSLENLPRIPPFLQDVSYQELEFIKNSLISKPVATQISYLLQILQLSESYVLLKYLIGRYLALDQLNQNADFIKLVFSTLRKASTNVRIEVIQELTLFAKQRNVRFSSQTFSKPPLEATQVLQEDFFSSIYYIFLQACDIKAAFVTLVSCGFDHPVACQILDTYKVHIMNAGSDSRKLEKNISLLFNKYVSGQPVTSQNYDQQVVIEILAIYFDYFGISLVRQGQSYLEYLKGPFKLDIEKYSQLIGFVGNDIGKPGRPIPPLPPKPQSTASAVSSQKQPDTAKSPGSRRMSEETSEVVIRKVENQAEPSVIKYRDEEEESKPAQSQPQKEDSWSDDAPKKKIKFEIKAKDTVVKPKFVAVNLGSMAPPGALPPQSGAFGFKEQQAPAADSWAQPVQQEAAAATWDDGAQGDTWGGDAPMADTWGGQPAEAPVNQWGANENPEPVADHGTDNQEVQNQVHVYDQPVADYGEQQVEQDYQQIVEGAAEQAPENPMDW